MAKGYPDFEGDKSGLFTIGDWLAREGEAYTWEYEASDKGFNEGIAATVPADTSNDIYITSITASCTASAAADGDNNQMCEVHLAFGGDIYVDVGGNGGVVVPTHPPIKVPAGESWIFTLAVKANHDCHVRLTARGFKITP